MGDTADVRVQTVSEYKSLYMNILKALDASRNNKFIYLYP